MPTASSARPTLAASPRDVLGKKVAMLRRDGKLPAVVYGHGVSSSSVTIDGHEFELLRRKAGPNALVDLSVDGKDPNPVRSTTSRSIRSPIGRFTSTSSSSR